MANDWFENLLNPRRNNIKVLPYKELIQVPDLNLECWTDSKCLLIKNSRIDTWTF